MGLFSSKYVVSVASVPYNMAGDLVDRVDFLKSTVSQLVLFGDNKSSISEGITTSLLRGPGMDQRSFFRWARKSYQRGMGTASLTQNSPVRASVVAPHIPVSPGFRAVISSSFIDNADPVYFARKHVLETRPEIYDTDWVGTYEGFTQTVTIAYVDGTSEIIEVEFDDTDGDYIVAIYYELSTAPEVPGVPRAEGPDRMFVYKIGSGVGSLDALATTYPVGPEFFPIIPLRLNNLPISDDSFDAHFSVYKKAYKKATGGDIQDALDAIDTNESKNDIDHAFLTFGVELNTPENIGRKYLYQFFKQLIDVQENRVAADLWINNPTAQLPARNKLVIKSDQIPEYNTQISWLSIRERRFPGLGRTGAQMGDYWFEALPDITIFRAPRRDEDGKQNLLDFGTTIVVPRCQLFWQESPTSHRVLIIYGMEHKNFVYGETAVTVNTTEALADTDESGFIVPLHFPTVEKFSIRDATDLAMINKIIVFNCYTVTKVRWYQRGIFKFLISFAIGFIAALVFPGAIGLLGSNAAVGASLGASGIWAAALGGGLNAVAGMLLFSVVESVAVTIFGEKWGAIIGSLVSFFTMTYAVNFYTNGTFGLNLAELFRAENLMKLVDAVTGGVAAWAKGAVGEIEKDMASEFEKYENEIEKLEKRALELLGTGGGFIDPLMFTKASDPSASTFSYAESRDSFLSRTLMTGSDIAGLSFSLIEDFASLGLQLPKAIV
jgi:hypothetical protein